MDSLPRKLISDSPNFTDTCYPQCDPSPDYCISDCLKFCIFNCPNRLPPLTTPIPHHTLFPKKFLVAAFVLGITIISLICLTVYYKFYSGQYIRRRRRQGVGGGGGEEGRSQIGEDFTDEDHGPELDHPIWYINTVGLQASVINSISVCRYKKGDGLVEGSDCSVCLSEFKEDESVRLLPKCSHAFHVPCIDTWLRSHTNCPLCRAPIVVSNPNPEITEEIGEIRGGETRIESQEGDDLGLDDEDRRKRVEFGEEGGVRGLRRSNSVDSIARVRRDDSVKEEIGTKRVVRASSSCGRSLGSGSSSLKRSISCGGKLLLQRYGRNSSSRRSVLPL